jgi:hypothetical protein
LSFRVAPGKNADAVKYFKKLLPHIKKLTGAELELATQLAGPAGHYIVTGRYKNVADWDAMRLKVANDAATQKMITENAALFIAGTTTSALWQLV